MKVLTIVSTVFFPSTVILGFFGTNFDNPRLTTLSDFIIMIGCIAPVTAGALFAFYRWGWIKRSRR